MSQAPLWPNFSSVVAWGVQQPGLSLSPSWWQWPCQLCARPWKQSRGAALSATVPAQGPASASGNIWMPRTSLHGHLLPAHLHRSGAWWPRGSQGRAPALQGVHVSPLRPRAPSVLPTRFWPNCPCISWGFALLPGGVLAPDLWCTRSPALYQCDPGTCPCAPSEGDMGRLGAGQLGGTKAPPSHLGQPGLGWWLQAPGCRGDWRVGHPACPLPGDAGVLCDPELVTPCRAPARVLTAASSIPSQGSAACGDQRAKIR